MILEPMKPIPANANPFHHDAYHMGAGCVVPADNETTTPVVVMYDYDLKYVIVVDKRTGQRAKVIF